MPTESENAGRADPAGRVRELLRGLAPPEPVSDAVLWAYASGSLDPDEDLAVGERVAADETAPARLEVMRAALAASARQAIAVGAESEALRPPVATPASVPVQGGGSAWSEAVRRFLAPLTLEPGELTAFLNRLPEGLMSAFLGKGCREVAWAPARLAEAESPDPSAPPKPSSRLRLVFADATEVTLVPQPGARIEVRFRLPDRGVEGEVRVSRRESRPEPAWRPVLGVGRPMQQGLVTLTNCPEGLLRFELPGGRSYVIGCTPLRGDDPTVQA